MGTRVSASRSLLRCLTALTTTTARRGWFASPLDRAETQAIWQYFSSSLARMMLNAGRREGISVATTSPPSMDKLSTQLEGDAVSTPTMSSLLTTATKSPMIYLLRCHPLQDCDGDGVPMVVIVPY